MAALFNEVNEAAQCEMFFEDLSTVSDLTTAVAATNRYRKMHGDYAQGFRFNGDILRNMLSASNSDLRIYMGIDANGFPTAVGVKVVNGDDADIPVSDISASAGILAEGRPCPSQCGKTNVLNRP